MARFNTVQGDWLQGVVHVTDTDIANCVAVAADGLNDSTVGRQQLGGRADTVAFQGNINPHTVSAGRGITGDGHDALVITAHFTPVGNAAIVDAAQLLSGQLLNRVVRVNDRYNTVMGNSERYDINAIVMGLLNFAILDPARGHADISHAVDACTNTVTGTGTSNRESGSRVGFGVRLGGRLHDRQDSGGAVDTDLISKHRAGQQGASGNGYCCKFHQTFHSSLLRLSVNYLGQQPFRHSLGYRQKSA